MMSISLETIIIGVLVLGALAWGVRAAWRSITHAGGCSSCPASGDCPLMKSPEELIGLKHQGDPSACAEPVDFPDKKKST